MFVLNCLCCYICLHCFRREMRVLLLSTNLKRLCFFFLVGVIQLTIGYRLQGKQNRELSWWVFFFSIVKWKKKDNTSKVFLYFYQKCDCEIPAYMDFLFSFFEFKPSVDLKVVTLFINQGPEWLLKLILNKTIFYWELKDFSNSPTTVYWEPATKES